MTTAFIGLLLGVLVVSVVGIWSARTARSARTASNEYKIKVEMQSERTKATDNTTHRPGPNDDNPNAMEMAKGTRKEPEYESRPYSGS